MRQQMSSPRPVPLPTGLVVSKGSRTWAATVSGMPGPLSPISTRTRSPSRAVRTLSLRGRPCQQNAMPSGPPRLVGRGQGQHNALCHAGIGGPQDLTVACLRGITPRPQCLFRSAHLDKEDTVIVADISFGDIFWSVLWFFFLFIWIMVLFHVLTDLFRDHSVSGAQKTLWVLFLVFLPFLAVFIYLIVRGKGMGERAAAQQQRAQQQFEGYVRNVAATGETTPTEQIARAKELLDAGAIDQSEFERLKAKALA
jgi:Phospholipase_D-nuclease N-terminal/Short C-terminal domain